MLNTINPQSQDTCSHRQGRPLHPLSGTHTMAQSRNKISASSPPLSNPPSSPIGSPSRTMSPFRWIFSLYISPLKLVLLSLSFCGQFFTWMSTDLFDLSLLHLTFYFLFPSSWRTSSLILSFIEGLFVFFILCIKEYSTHNCPEPQTLERPNFFLLILSQSSLLSFSAEINHWN